MPLPTWLRRRSTEPEQWQPGNPKRLADDFQALQADAAELGRQLTVTRQALDVEAARASAAAQRAEAAEGEHSKAAELLKQSHRGLRDVADERDRLTTANSSLRRQLHREFGYDEAAIDAIENGSGEPAGKRALT
ncbi:MULTISPECIES: hypothetical protein [unclassified Kitasatospora]|uniref:hypothetical protein n=1 Tax=unclassified Kitasatospora TaxID=2633591 RepID=UPI002475E6BE|nr:hypothetical protein [Kitasatospora sp. GAS204B]